MRHGLTGTPEHQAWKSMNQRCSNPRRKQYPDYGGRGIRVCARWRSSFLAFLGDMGPRPGPGYSLERRNNALGYEPGNCYWATRGEQNLNRRSARRISVDGLTLSIAEWARRSGISKSLIAARLDRLGWEPTRAVTQPARPDIRTAHRE